MLGETEDALIWKQISSLIERNEAYFFAVLVAIAVVYIVSFLRSRLLLMKLKLDAARFKATLARDFDDLLERDENDESSSTTR